MENELLPLCRDNGIVVQVYSPLEQGLLTGTITRDYVPGGARANKVWFQRENMLKVIDMLEQWQPLCARYQCTIPTLALAWILKQSDLISILSGATAPEQVRENVAALNINLSDADATLMKWQRPRSVKYSTRFTSVSVKTVMKICDSNRLF